MTTGATNMCSLTKANGNNTFYAFVFLILRTTVVLHDVYVNSSIVSMKMWCTSMQHENYITNFQMWNQYIVVIPSDAKHNYAIAMYILYSTV